MGERSSKRFRIGRRAGRTGPRSRRQETLVHVQRRRCAHRRDARAIVMNAHMRTEIDARSLMIPIPIGDRRRQGDQTGSQRNGFVAIHRRVCRTLVYRAVEGRGHVTRSIHRKGKLNRPGRRGYRGRALAGYDRTALQEQEHVVARQRVDQPAVHSTRTDRQPIADACSIRSVHMGECPGKCLRVHRRARRTGPRPRRQEALVHIERRRRPHRRDARTVVMDAHMRAQVDARRLMITVRIGDRCRQGDQTGGQRDGFVAIDRRVRRTLMHRAVERRRHVTRSIHRQGELNRSGRRGCRGRAFARHHRTALQEQEDMIARQRVDQPAVHSTRADRQSVADTRTIRSVHVGERSGKRFRIGRRAGRTGPRSRRQEAFVHIECRRGAHRRDARTIVMNAHMRAQIDARRLMITVRIRDRRCQGDEPGGQRDRFAAVDRRVRRTLVYRAVQRRGHVARSIHRQGELNRSRRRARRSRSFTGHDRTALQEQEDMIARQRVDQPAVYSTRTHR
ncbi:hypothetical protein CfE428DRAFT_6704 [Chthoniobacter flavus Ellin428]|uniref:Uncharacterized protein n=1 Tax=Chthoniobacter flavus Ellin428 TaxID=497964 RepID=B4DCR3_9BACT|nr:hypothetical protein CfE428DRAFT_6704 [Chthoniobacter flavus Ellin428]